MKFRKKPVVIEAIQWEGDNTDELDEFAPEARFKIEGHRNALVIETLEGTMLGEPGDWIIRGVKGELYPCMPDIFAATYEPVESSASPQQENCGVRITTDHENLADRIIGHCGLEKGHKGGHINGDFLIRDSASPQVSKECAGGGGFGSCRDGRDAELCVNCASGLRSRGQAK